MKHFRIALFLPVLFLWACGSEPEKKSHDNLEMPEDMPLEQTQDGLIQRATEIFYAMPSPLELTSLIRSAGGYFRKDLLHDPGKAGDYQSLLKRSLNLGVYGTDLSYSSVFDQQQDALKFLAASKRVGENIGIHDAFSAELIERANAQMDNKDSLLVIFTEMYWQTNSQLDEENRNHIAFLVMAGGWAEGLYLGSQLLDDKDPDPEITERLMEQKYTAMQMQDMFKTYASDAVVVNAKALFDPILQFFEKLQIKEEGAANLKEGSSGTMTIGGKKVVEYSKEDVVALKKISAEVRTKIITQ